MSLRNHDFRDVLRVLDRFGFKVVRRKGSHIMMAHKDGRYATVPRHSPLKETTLKSVLDQAGISKDDFLKSV